ncbi:toxolysin TLN4 [Toxoplasma gondii p89]|uniref:Toxolysin TLN4 n=1 Tax=Toxoplasma gondii p89 TaxID=943119 RepID=A0A086JP30_TOXGO|nr:toxolysin TLN4 [Toxoplasma gondii p89]
MRRPCLFRSTFLLLLALLPLFSLLSESISPSSRSLPSHQTRALHADLDAARKPASFLSRSEPALSLSSSRETEEDPGRAANASARLPELEAALQEELQAAAVREIASGFSASSTRTLSSSVSSPSHAASVAEAETRPDSSSDPVNDGDSTSGGETPDPLPTLAEVRAALASTVAQSRTFPRRLAAKNGEQVEDGDEELAERKRVRKPPRDTSAYSVFSVPALKLEGVAIADQEEAVGSFAVSVGCGFFHDPPAIPGVAHQLEHLIFLGAEGEEAATSWDEFVSQRGGTHNAHTTAELTTFFVAAPTDTLPELLDRFLLHLFHPLLAAEQFASEVMAVQFEHEKNQPDVARVLLELAMAVTPSLASPASSATQDEVPTSFYRPEVARKFGTGDFDTLCKTPLEQGLDVLKALREFHGKCYKPENMTIAVRMGRRSVPIIVEGAVDASGQSLRIPAEVEAAAEREAEKRSVYTPKEIGEMVVRILSKYVQANSPETEAHADKTKTPHNKGNSFSASSSSDLTPQRTPSDASSSASPSVSSAPASSQAKRRNEVLKTVRLHAGERQKEESQVASFLEAAVGEDAYRSRPNATAEDSSPTDGESDASK